MQYEVIRPIVMQYNVRCYKVIDHNVIRHMVMQYDVIHPIVMQYNVILSRRDAIYRYALQRNSS